MYLQENCIRLKRIPRNMMACSSKVEVVKEKEPMIQKKSKYSRTPTIRVYQKKKKKIHRYDMI